MFPTRSSSCLPSAAKPSPKRLPLSRGTGRSAVAAAAYMSCSRMYNDYDGVQHDYTRKSWIHTSAHIPSTTKLLWIKSFSMAIHSSRFSSTGSATTNSRARRLSFVLTKDGRRKTEVIKTGNLSFRGKGHQPGYRSFCCCGSGLYELHP